MLVRSWKSPLLSAGALLTGSLLLTAAAGMQTAPTQKVDFAHEVQPLLKAHCVQCHGVERHEAGLRLDAALFALKSGKAIVPGHGAQSLLIARIEGRGGLPRMPMGFAPLTSGQIARIRLWIDQGASWPQSAIPRHWAYVKPVRPTPPHVMNTAWVRNPIDNFVLARLEKEGLHPSPAAPREILLRRVTLDLAGLPPSVRDLDAFLADKSPNAYEKVVDRLLASPQYGERWARPWLDMARYADTNGYEKDSRRLMWPYRDWVINALNKDMPFDEFTIEQIAGDLLPNATNDQKVATGFNRNTMQNEEGGVDRGEQRWLTDVDRVGTTASVWLGTTMACTQCHDHKYDPFTQKEFYRFIAYFEHCDEPTLELPTPEQATQRTNIQTEMSSLDKTIRNPATDKAALKTAQDRKAALQKQLDAIQFPTTLVMAEKADHQTPSSYVRIKGAYLSKSDLVTCGTPASLNPFPAGRPQNRLGLAYWIVDPNNPLTARVAVNRFWEQYFGHGIVETSEDFGTQGQPPSHPQLLDWLATEFIRRHWSMKAIHRLIVTSATYRQSSRVTPALHERDPYNRLLARGPRFRMEAEMIRDSALEAAGLLSLKIGGPSVFPLQPEGVWSIPYNEDRWNTSAGEDKYRRALYTFWRRTSPYPAMLTFDATSREYCTIRRIRTNTPLQALTTLNDPAFIEAARGLAKRMIAEGERDPAARLTYGFRLCVARRPKPAELTRLVALYDRELHRYRADPKAAYAILGIANPPITGKRLDLQLTQTPPELGVGGPEEAALTIVSNVLLNLDEALTKE